MDNLRKTERTFGRIAGVSPSENKFYILVMFDISDRKKYTHVTKLLKRHARRIQNSVYEAHLKMSDFKKLVESMERLMSSKKYFNPDDRVRIYKMSGLCDATIFGEYADNKIDLEVNIFI